MDTNLTQKRLKEVLNYYPDWGIFTWKIITGVRIKIGQLAGTKTNHNYILIAIDGKRYYAHRLAFLYMTGEWPKAHIDHKDRDGTNNKWENIREATPSENHGNLIKHIDNMSGIKGVWWSNNRLKWIAQIMVNGKRLNLGSFDNKEEAAKAYEIAAIKHFNQFARTE